MVKIGMMIGDRYEILEKIGTGGMSDVYKAKCHKLNRFVAIKVLKQEFVENENFVSKFRVEAQAAAGLMHPNIVNVYDVGEEKGIHYIVMELVEGITLKKYIERKSRLSYKEAVSIAIQVSMGIDSAHKNHIIHRDIKPQNIIISKEGKVKVTDFGIAKAATSNTITSNVMGSVHYTSPEQARGGFSDEKSDIYSLGITLFEMLTGRVPFNGETTVAIAIKHIQEEMPSPAMYVPDLPISVEAIVMKCCQKSPDRRYQNIEELIADLKMSLTNPDEDFVVNTDPDTEGGTRMVSSQEMEVIKKKSAGRDSEEGMRLNNQYTEIGESEQVQEELDRFDREESQKEKIATIFAVILGIVIFIIIVILLSKIFSTLNLDDIGDKIVSGDKSQMSSELTPAGPTQSQQPTGGDGPLKVPMIRVTNYEVNEATKLLRDMGMRVEVNSVASDEYAEGTVIRASVEEGTPIEVDTLITLTVSSGSMTEKVADVVHLSYEEAYSRLSGQGFKVKREEGNSSEVESGYIISQMPLAGESLAKGEAVTITVSVGISVMQVKMPSVIGITEMDATVTLAEYGLSVNDVRYVYSNDVASGLVCYQSVEKDTIMDKGDSVDIAVSLGAEESTYKCNAVIDAPSVEEAPDFISGSSVAVTLVTDDGKVLMDMNTTTFPQTANFYGITCSAGTVTLTYQVTEEGSTTIDPDSGEVTSLPGETRNKTITRRIEFVKE